MKIVQVTAGTGGWLCGTCLRDNELVRGLHKVGHESTLVPMYLPVTVDGEHASPDERVRLGGVSVWLRHESALWRALPAWADAVVDSKSMLGFAAKRSGMTQPGDLGSLTVAMLRATAHDLGPSLDRFAKSLAADHKPDVVILSNALLLGVAKPLKAALGVPVVCSLQGEFPFIEALPEPFRSEAWAAAREAAKQVDAFVSVSAWHADVMAPKLGLSRESVHVIHNGLDATGFEPRPEPAVRTLGFFARQCPDKGLHTLVSSWLELRKRPGFGDVRFAIGGAVTGADEAFVADQAKRIADAGLADAVSWLPNATKQQKIQWFRDVTVFSVPATYGESFGLFVLEALASGVPVVVPAHGAFPEVIAATGGGVTCAADDVPALTDAIAKLLDDPARRATLAAEGRRNVLERFTLESMARGVAAVCERVRR